MKEISLWQLPKKSTHVILEKEIQKQLFEKAAAKEGSLYELTKLFGENDSVYYWHNGTRETIPLWALEKIALIAGESLEEIEQNATGVKSGYQGTTVKMAFPIAITPEFDAIVANLLGDGCFSGYGKTASYKQKNEFARRLFTEKLRRCLGKFELNEKQYAGQWKVIIPKIIIECIETVYQFEETDTLSRRVPKEIKTKEKEFRVAFLAAFVLDEGHVNEGIEVYSGNKLLLQDVLEIVEGLGYEATEIRERDGHGSKNCFYRFRIKVQGCKNFLADLDELCKKHPNCGLAHKYEALKFASTRVRHKTLNGVTREEILKILPEVKTVKAITRTLKITSSTVREHLKKLEKTGKVEKIGREQNRTIWQPIT